MAASIPPSEQLKVFEKLRKIAVKMVKKDDPRYRTLFLNNAKLQSSVLIYDGGLEFLFNLGFIPEGRESRKLVCTEVNVRVIEACLLCLDDKIETLRDAAGLLSLPPPKGSMDVRDEDESHHHHHHHHHHSSSKDHSFDRSRSAPDGDFEDVDFSGGLPVGYERERSSGRARISSSDIDPAAKKVTRTSRSPATASSRTRAARGGGSGPSSAIGAGARRGRNHATKSSLSEATSHGKDKSSASKLAHMLGGDETDIIESGSESAVSSSGVSHQRRRSGAKYLGSGDSSVPSSGGGARQRHEITASMSLDFVYQPPHGATAVMSPSLDAVSALDPSVSGQGGSTPIGAGATGSSSKRKKLGHMLGSSKYIWKVFVFIRHGNSIWNSSKAEGKKWAAIRKGLVEYWKSRNDAEAHNDSTVVDAPLSTIGIREAYNLSSLLSRHFNLRQVQRLQMIERQKRLAEPIQKALRILNDEVLIDDATAAAGGGSGSSPSSSSAFSVKAEPISDTLKKKLETMRSELTEADACIKRWMTESAAALGGPSHSVSGSPGTRGGPPSLTGRRPATAVDSGGSGGPSSMPIGSQRASMGPSPATLAVGRMDEDWKDARVTVEDARMDLTSGLKYSESDDEEMALEDEDLEFAKWQMLQRQELEMEQRAPLSRYESIVLESGAPETFLMDERSKRTGLISIIQAEANSSTDIFSTDTLMMPGLSPAFGTSASELMAPEILHSPVMGSAQPSPAPPDESVFDPSASMASADGFVPTGSSTTATTAISSSSSSLPIGAAPPSADPATERAFAHLVDEKGIDPLSVKNEELPLEQDWLLDEMINPNTSVVTCSNLRRAISTAIIGLWDRLGASEEQIYILPFLQELGMNVDAHTPVVESSVPEVSKVERHCGMLDIETLSDFYRTRLAVAKTVGYKKSLLESTEQSENRMRCFLEWAFTETDKRTVIAVGHSHWFRHFFKTFLPPDSKSHPASKKKIMNCGAVAFRMCCEIRDDSTNHFTIQAGSITTIYGGFL